MKPRTTTAISAVACAAFAVVAGANGPVTPAVTVPPPDQLQALSGLDIPISGERGKELIESSFCPEIPGGCTGTEPVDTLIQLARNPDADPGVRLRAYRALGLYPGTTAKNALEADLPTYANASPGTDQLYLRAVIEAIGEIGGPGDVTNITPFLDYEPSRDIRAATADALRNIGCHCTQATAPLHARLATEPSQQVVLAIQRALRELTQGT